MIKNWEPKEEQLAIISRTIEFIADELDELQEELSCPNSFIYEIANRLASPYRAEQNIIKNDLE